MTNTPAFEVGSALESLAGLVSASKSGQTQGSALLTSKTVQEMQDKTILIQLLDFDISTNSVQPSTGSLENPGLVSTDENLKNFMYIFRNSPDELVDVRPVRTTVTQTRGGYWVEDFGPGIREIHLKGHTGFKKMLTPSPNGSFEEIDGKQLKKRLARIFKIYNEERRARYEKGRDYRKFMMLFRMYSEEDVNLVVHPTSFQILRSKNNPLLYMYDIKFVVLGEYEQFISNVKDPIVKLLNDPENRFPRIMQRFNTEFKNALSLVISDPYLVNSLGDLGMRTIGNLFSISSAFEQLVDGSEDETIQKTVSEDNEQVISVLTKREKSAYNLLSGLQSVNSGLSSEALAAIGDQDYLAATLKAIAIFPTTDAWNNKSIQEFASGDLGKFTGSLVNEGTKTYDLVRGMRQIQACINSLSLYPELFSKSYEDIVSGRRKSLLDSGCATTLREE